MSQYVAPLKDMRFVLNELAGLGEVAKLPGYEDATADTVDAVLEEASKFASEVLDPLNFSGDQEGSVWKDGKVTTPKGFKEAYKQYTDGGWGALPFGPDHGGQGLPKLVATAVEEMLTSANMAFSLCPLLTQGAIHALELAGTDVLKATYLEKMVAGRWTGTMNLTEPQAGSDLALVRTKAVPQGDHYLISGQKIFITYGDHDMSENIVHLVLARTPDAPEGVKGISLFVVPKFLPKADGTPGERNTAKCASIEHKLGIHASPTAVMVFENARGYLVGEVNKGLSYMFIMMNAARFSVGLEGVSIAERAFQRALAYAKDRLQGKDLVQGGATVPIIKHPDVRRMLMLMKSQTEAARALAYVVAASMDFASRTKDKKHQAFVDLMIPVVKGWSTETGIDVASLGVQIHGGMGFIEETGAAQHLRDARITTIYEGTTGIQAGDLVGRKIAREGGVTVKGWLALLKGFDQELSKSSNADIQVIRARLAAGAQAVSGAVDFILGAASKDPNAAFAGAVPFLKLMGIVAGGWQLARAALIAEKKLAAKEGDQSFYAAKIVTARFFADHVLSQAAGLAATVSEGAASVMALSEEQFLGRLTLSAAEDIRDQLVAARVVPVLRMDDTDLTALAADCLAEAGFRAIEITMTTPGAVELLRDLSRRIGARCVIGAGTVLDETQARRCIDAGARFLVSPAVVAGLARAAHEGNCAALIGAYTPSEVLAAAREGADIVKLFPASSGGPAHLAAIRAVFPGILLCPTGGLTAENMGAYFKAGASLVGIGNALLPMQALKEGRREAVVAHAARFLAA